MSLKYEPASEPPTHHLKLRCVGGPGKGGCHAKLSILRTPLVEEAVQVFGDWVTQTVRPKPTPNPKANPKPKPNTAGASSSLLLSNLELSDTKVYEP